MVQWCNVSELNQRFKYLGEKKFYFRESWDISFRPVYFAAHQKTKRIISALIPTPHSTSQPPVYESDVPNTWYLGLVQGFAVVVQLRFNRTEKIQTFPYRVLYRLY